MLQEHVKTTKTDKTRFFCEEKMNLVPNNHLSLNVPFESNNFRKKRIVRRPQSTRDLWICLLSSMWSEKCVYISTNKTTTFYDCRRCKACCHVLNIPFKDQKPTIMLFGGDGTHCFARKTSCDFEKEKPSPFSKKFGRQSDPSTSKPEPKKAEVIPFMV